jgi:hypothetical protein
MRILLISHQLDFSGAPLALLNLARTLIELGHTVVLSSLQNGPLGSYFVNAGVAPLQSGDHPGGDFDLLIANTSPSVGAAVHLAGTSTRVVAWIHESRDFFIRTRSSPSSLGFDKLFAMALPTRFQKKELQPLTASLACFHLPNRVELSPEEPSTAPDVEAAPYWVCCGPWTKRKNQQTLLALLDQCRIAAAIRFLGASPPAGLPPGRHAWTGKLPPAQAHALIRRSRGLVSCSRAEVQPLSVIESLLAGNPVLLSDIPAHRELFEACPDINLFSLHQPATFVQGWQRMQQQWQDPACRARLQQFAQVTFGRAQFRQNVAALLQSCQSAS